MSILDYKNIEEIKDTLTEVVKAEVISEKHIKLLKISDSKINAKFDINSDIIEICIYSGYDGLLLSGYIANVKRFIDDKNKELKEFQQALGLTLTQHNISDFFTVSDNYIHFNRDKFIDKYYPELSGKLRLNFNFLKTIASNESFTDLILFEASTSRSECRIKYINKEKFDFNSKMKHLESVDMSISQQFYVNFGNGNLFLILNTHIEESDSIILKLYDPLPSSIEDKSLCYLCEKIINSYVLIFDRDIRLIDEIELQFLVPNFSIKTKQEIKLSPSFRNLDSLVSAANKSTVLSFLSSSSDELKINYNDYSNFVFYSSAAKRLENFKYKLNKLEDYQSDFLANSTLNQLYPETYSSSLRLTSNINEIKSRFTLYEKYLYYESSSYSTGSYGEFFENSWPKSSTTKPYGLYSISSSKADTWYSSQLYSSSLYDSRNLNYIKKTIPEFIQDDDSNSEYITFVDMVGEFFDETFFYIKNLTNRNVNRLSKDDGMSTMVVANLLNQFGTSLMIDFDNIELSELFMNYDSSGNFISTGLNPRAIKDQKNVLYKKYINNLMYFLKTKGTINNLHSLTNMFGIDRDYYEIREFGGPDIKRRQFNSQSIDTPSLEYLNLEYSLGMAGSQNIKLLWRDSDSKKPDSIIFKFKLNSITPTSQSLFESKNKFAVIAEKTTTSGDSGKLKFLLTGSSGIRSASTSELPIFDGNFWNVLLQRSVSTSGTNSNQTYTLKTNKVKFDRINNYVSSSLQITGSLTSSYNGSYNESTDFYVGSVLPTSSFLSVSPLVGNVSDLKFYRGVLRDDIFKQHSLAQTLLLSNNTSASFEDLVTHFTFNDNKNLALTSSIYDANLSSYGKNHGTSSGFSENTFEVRYEKNIIKPKTISFAKPVSEKVRIESNYVNPISGNIYLNSNSSVETSSFDNFGVDSNRLSFIFSSANIENKNIISHLNPELNDFIGDPSFLFDDVETYSGLTNFYKFYRKYKPQTDLQDYIDNTYKLSKNLFKNIKQFIPERISITSGISIEPNILERINVVMNKSIRIENLLHNVILPSTLPSLVNNYLLYTSSISIQEIQPAVSYTPYTSSISVSTPELVTTYPVYSDIIDAQSITEPSAYYLVKGVAEIINRDDIMFTQGIKKRNFRTSFVTSSNGPNFYTIQSDGVYEVATGSFIEPISNFKPSMTYNTSSGNFYLKRNSAMEPLYDINYNSYYASNHIKHHIYNSAGNKRSYFFGSQNTGPEYITGATTSDGGSVIEITFIPSNKISFVAYDENKPRLKVDGIDFEV